MVGDMDYKKIRNSETTLTEKEIGYCINDVKAVEWFKNRHDGEKVIRNDESRSNSTIENG